MEKLGSPGIWSRLILVVYPVARPFYQHLPKAWQGALRTVLRVPPRANKPVTGAKKPVTWTIVRVGSTARATSVATEITGLASRAGVGVFVGGSPRGLTRINFDQDAADVLKQLVIKYMEETDDLVLFDQLQRKISSRRLIKLDNGHSFAVGLRIGGRSRKIFCEVIELVPWRRAQRPGGEVFVSSRENRIVSRAFSLAKLVEAGDLESLSCPSRFWDQSRFPIDAVYTWVDGSDPTWMDKKHAAIEQITGKSVASNSDERYRSRDELRYSLRSLFLFAPFIRNVYIVTDAQRPDWLVGVHPRLRVVDHREIFADPSVLPVFNSHAIETQLHHIPSLAEHFVYFNDDMLIGNLADRADFFTASGLSVVYPDSVHVIEALLPEHADVYQRAHANVARILERDYSVLAHSMFRHVPYALKKSVLFEMESRYPDEFRRTAAAKFRSSTDISVASFFYQHYAMLNGHAVAGKADHRYIPLWAPSLRTTLKNLDAKRDARYICLNDANVDKEKLEEIDLLVGNFLKSYLPVPSEFEKDSDAIQ